MTDEYSRALNALTALNAIPQHDRALAKRLSNAIRGDDAVEMLSQAILAELAVKKVHWNEGEHPRDHDGQFTDKPGAGYVTSAASRNQRVLGGGRIAAAAAAAQAEREAVSTHKRPPVMGEVWEHNGDRVTIVGLTPDVVKVRRERQPRKMQIPRDEFMARYRKVKDAPNQDEEGDYGGYFS